MWYIKYEFRHKDCKYLPKADELKVVLYSQTLSHYIKDGVLHVSAIHTVEGDTKNVQEYLDYLRTISLRFERMSHNTVFTQSTMSTNMKYYTAVYNPFLFFFKPVKHTGNFEYGEIMSWEKSHLQKLMLAMSENEETDYFKLLSLKQVSLKNIFMMKAVEKITDKQRELFEFAKNNGYYEYPRKINLKDVALHFKIDHTTAHEILRRAENNLIRGIM
ncbi:MAG: helix-turn-helix domain-containing protein [Nanoarchaeota archaeon]|nr:helix-turn-helix domain-containing protein [Nanoarchaeota archaeon]